VKENGLEPQVMAKEQWEEETIERFRDFLSRERSATYGISDRDVVVDPTTGVNFDYQLTSSSGDKVAVEISRLVESGTDLASAKVWSQIVTLLKQKLTEQGIKGYLVALPKMHIPLRAVGTYAHHAAARITTAISDNAGVETFSAGGMTFRRIEEYESISFSWGGEARYVNPHGTAETAFLDILPKKNKQVGILDHERIVVVVNWSMFVDEGNVVRALSRIDFDAFQNVDRIFFEDRSDRFFQVYERTTYNAIVSQQPSSVGDPALLLRYLEHQLADRKKEAYGFVKATTLEAGSIEWLSSNAAKVNLVRYAEGFAETGQLDEAMWAIRQLKYDPDPDPDGENSPDDPDGEYNSHRRILNGEEERGITTVRGHLCWLIVKVIVQNKPTYYAELIEILTRYISERNLYIRTQSMIPLTDLAVRLRAVRNEDGSEFTWDRDGRAKVRALAFHALAENVEYPRVLQMLLPVFDRMKDIKESEAMTVLRVFLDTEADYILHDLAALIIYFALFRSKDFTGEGLFDAANFVELLKQQISGGRPSMRASLVWHFWKILQAKYLPFEEIREYLPIFWMHEYDQGLASSFDLLFDELIVASPSDASDIFAQMMERLKGFMGRHEKLTAEIWISGVDKLIPLFVDNPHRLLRVVGVLVDARKKGAFIHDLATTLESYRLIAESHRETVKVELRKLHCEIRELDTRFPEIDWSH
jgi:hypothetical protein